MSEPGVYAEGDQQHQEDEEEETDLFATDETEPETSTSIVGETRGATPYHAVLGTTPINGIADNKSDETFTAHQEHPQEENLNSAVVSESSDSAQDAMGPRTEKNTSAFSSPSAPRRSSAPLTPDGVPPPLSTLEVTPNSNRDVQHIPRKSHVDAPFLPGKPISVSTAITPSSFGLPDGVVIPSSVDSNLLQGRLLETLRNLPLQLINDALVEYDDAVQIKGEAIRNRGAYLYGVIKRYVNVQDRASKGETEGSLPMGPDLTPSVQERLNKLVEKGFCSHEEMNDKIKSKIRMLSEKDALFAVDELASVERYQIRNFGSYFMGILNRYMRGEAQYGGAKGKPNNHVDVRGGPRSDDRKPDDRQQRGRSPDRDRRVNLGRDRHGESFRRERSRDRFEHPHHRQQQPQQQQQQHGDRFRRFRPNDAPTDSFRRNNDSFVDRSRYDPRQEPPQPPPPHFLGGQPPRHQQQHQEAPMLGGFVNSVPPPPPRPNAHGMPAMSNFQQPQQQYMQPNQHQQMGSQQVFQQPMSMQPQQQQQFLSPVGPPNFPGQQPLNVQQNYQQQPQQPMMNQQHHQYGNQPQQQSLMLNQQQQMMNQQQSRPMGVNQQSQSSYLGNQMQSSLGGIPQQQQSNLMNPQSQHPQHLSYQPQSVMGNQQQQPLQGSYLAAPQASSSAWPQSQAPVDILGLADKAASAVQAIAASQNKLHVAPQYAGNAPLVPNMLSSSSSSFPMAHQQQQSPPLNPYGNNNTGMNNSQYAPRQPPVPPPPPHHLQQQQQQQQQLLQMQQQQRRGRTTATLEDLPVNVRYAIQNLMVTQQVDGPLDSGMLGMVKDLPEVLALAAIEKFTTIDKNTMRNKTAYLAGVLRRELEKINRR